MAGGVINSGNYPKELVLGVHTWWESQGKRFDPIWKKSFKTVTSDQSYEEYVNHIGTGTAPRKFEGQGVSYDSMRQGYTTRLTNLAYAMGVIFTHEEIQDNKYPKLTQQRMTMLRNSFDETDENIHASVFNNAFNATYAGGDGINLISTGHVTAAGLTLANKYTVDADLNESSLEDMLVLIGTAKSDEGFQRKLMGEQLIVAPQNQFNAYRILKSIGQSGTGNNDVNAIKGMGMLSGGIIVNPYLTSPTAWYIHTDAEEGLISQEREALKLFEDNDFDTRNFKTFGYMRKAVGWIDFRCMYGSNA